MPDCYEEYLALGKDICAAMNFKDYVYLSYGFWLKDVYQEAFKNRKPLKEEDTPKEKCNPS